MLAAGIVEFARLQFYKKGRILPEKFHSSQIVDLSVFWQIPQYLLVGLSEVHPSFLQPSSAASLPVRLLTMSIGQLL